MSEKDLKRQWSYETGEMLPDETDKKMVKNLQRAGSEGVKILSVNGENTIDIPIEIIDPSQAKQQPEQIEEAAGNLFLFGFERDF